MRGYDRAVVDGIVAHVCELLDQLEDQAAAFGEERDREHQLREQTESDLEQLRKSNGETEVRLREVTGERDELAGVLEAAAREREEFANALKAITEERDERIAYTERIERELARCRDVESSLTHAFAAAERAGSEVRAQAERDAAAVLEHAQKEAHDLIGAAAAERDRVLADAFRIRAMLESARAAFDDLSPRTAPDTREPAGPDTFPSGDAS